MTDLNTYVVTFNCGREPINTDFFAAHLFDGFKPRDVSPDLIVLGLQEIAPIAYSFLSASMLRHYTDRFEAAVTAALNMSYGAAVAEEFQLLQTRNVGMTAVMLLARRDVRTRLTRVDTAGVGVGLWEMGNKGAIGVRLWIEDELGEDSVPFTFVAAHLAPMENAWERRNEDWRSICQRLVFTSDATQQRRSSEDEPLLAKDDDEQAHEQDMFSPLNALFFAGDLNYRTSDVKPQQDDHKAWAAPHSDDFASMLKQDQLTRERNAGQTLHLMDEAEVTFPPSYKYSSQAQKQALELAKHPASAEATLWASHRIPSWCDRILFLADAKPEVHSYTTLPIQPTSDHRPVALSLTLPIKKLAHSVYRPPFSIDKSWKAKRAAARRLEVLVGIAAYLTLTNEGRAILVGTVVGIAGIVLTSRFLTTG